MHITFLWHPHSTNDVSLCRCLWTSLLTIVMLTIKHTILTLMWWRLTTTSLARVTLTRVWITACGRMHKGSSPVGAALHYAWHGMYMNALHIRRMPNDMMWILHATYTMIQSKLCNSSQYICKYWMCFSMIFSYHMTLQACCTCLENLESDSMGPTSAAFTNHISHTRSLAETVGFSIHSLLPCKQLDTGLWRCNALSSSARLHGPLAGVQGCWLLGLGWEFAWPLSTKLVL